MSRLFLIAASGSKAREHLNLSLADGVDLSLLSSLSAIQFDLAGHSYKGKVFTWGASPGPGNLRTWERLAPGDVGLVYSQGSFPFCARVFAKAQSAKVAESIWGTHEEETWELMYFLDRPRVIDASLERVRDDLGYELNWVPQGFSFLGQAAENRLLDEYGGFEQFLSQISVDGTKVAFVAEPPEVHDAVAAVAQAVGKPSGQGRQMSAPVRRAVELHAMKAATKYYEDQDWTVIDVSARESYDLLCTKDGQEDLRVEVKGTTSFGAEVVLTRNEVANAKAEYPNVSLVVVADIAVDRSGPVPTCAEGELRVIDPWAVGDGTLDALAYSYRVPQAE